MNLSKLFAAIAALFTHPSIDVAAAAPKLQQVQTGIETAAAVVSALPDGNTKNEALQALDAAASIAGQAIVVAHTLEGVAG